MTSITGFDNITYEAGEAVGADSNEIWYLTATEAITKGLFVELGTGATSGKCEVADATVGGHIGIALKAAAASGDVIPVLVAGYGTVTADATGVKIGDYIKPDSSGKADVAAIATDTVVALAANNSGAGGVAVVKLMMISLDTNT